MYAKKFFVMKFIVYIIYIMILFWDLESLNVDVNEEERKDYDRIHRRKDW